MTQSKALFICFALLFVVAHSWEHVNCTHDHHDNPEPQKLDVEEDMSYRDTPETERRLTSVPNIRIMADYDNLNTAPSSYKYYIQNELAPAVISYWEATLGLKYPVSGNLVMPSVQTQLCGWSTPSYLFSPGVQADFFILFASTEADGQGWIANSYVCYMASGTNRPMVSSTTFNRAYLVDPQGDILVHEKNTYLLLHEMTHTFGFTASMFPYFIDSNGKTLTGHIKSGYLDGALATVIDVAPLTNNLRSFFGCSSLAGAYLETTGSSGTAGSHFNRRQYVFEYMTSGLLFQQRVSEFALNMLEGSGWYVPNYDYAEPYTFGQGEGCGFLFNSCTGSGFNYDEFCYTSGLGCTYEGRGGGYCMSDTRSAGCKYYTPNENYDCQNPNAASYAIAPELQVFGRSSGSKCFNGNLAESGNTPKQSSYCFNYKCQGSGVNTVLTITVGRYQVTCAEEGSVTIPGYSGTVQCPDPVSYCNTAGLLYCPRNCMGRGVCRNNACDCYSGYTGVDCAISTTFGVS